MLNDYLITRDVIAFVTKYIKTYHPELESYLSKLESFGNKAISYAQWWSFLDELDQLIDEPALGLAIGKEVKAGDCGVLGYLFRTSHNMAEALSCYSRFERLLYAGSEVETTQEQGAITLTWPPEKGYSSLISDALLLAGLVSVARDILDPEPFSPLCVKFTHPLPATEKALYESYFQCVIEESQNKLCIQFDPKDLFKPIPHQDSVLHSLLGKQAEEQLQQLPESDLFMASLHDTIVRCLHEGRPDAEAVAQSLNISGRTLHRRLKTKERVYRDVLRDIRKSMAERYLKDPKLNLSEVALLLGYQDQSAFTRAFKLWFNESPKQYKKRTNLNK